MCEPVTIIAGVSAAFSAFSAYEGAKADKEAANFNAAVQRNNAARDELRARDAINRGSDKIFARRLKQSQTVGTQRAAFAARGLSLDVGSPLNVLLDTEFIADIDVDTLRHNSDMEAWSLRQDAGAHRAQADLLTSQASSISPGLAGFTSLLGGAAQTIGVHQKFKAPSETATEEAGLSLATR